MIWGLSVSCLLLALFPLYTIYHAFKHGEERRLEFFLFGDCTPRATDEEVYRWTEFDSISALH